MTMRLQIPSNASVEFFSLRTTPHEYRPVAQRLGPESNTDHYLSDYPITPVESIAKLTRECSALRLRLATAERLERQSHHGSSSPASSSATLSAVTPPYKTTGLTVDHSAYTQHGYNPRHKTTSTVSYNTDAESVFTTRTRTSRTSYTPNQQRRPESRASTVRSSDTVRPSRPPRPPRPPRPEIRITPPEPIPEIPPKRRPARGENMKPAERCKQLEKTLKEVQELLRVRDREIEVLKKERDRLLTEKESERNTEKERETARERERSQERERERERAREREREKERERERQREREQEREREKERQRERERERERPKEQDRSFERERASVRRFDATQRPLSTVTDINMLDRNASTSPTMRRSKSQAPVNEPRHSVASLGPESEQLAQLRSLDVFLTKTDTWSGAQVIQAVVDLNAEITHFAASATESCVFERRTPAPVASPKGGRKGKGRRNRNSMAMDSGRSTPTKQGPSQELLDSVPWLGQAFARILGTRDHAQDPMLVQLALQASVAICCARSLSLFCVGFPSKLDGLLSRVFAHMQGSEPQPTSSRWRSLTHRSIRTLYPGLEEYAVSELVTTMLRWSAAIFTLCGCATPPPNNHNHNASKDPVLGSPTLRAQLRRIAEAVYKLAKVTREEILSTSFEVILADPGSAFEEVMMVNAFTDQRTSPNGNGKANGKANGKGDGVGKVLCTTELGLKCITKKAKTITGDESETSTVKGVDPFDKRILLPPKVMLDSAVDALTAE